MQFQENSKDIFIRRANILKKYLKFINDSKKKYSAHKSIYRKFNIYTYITIY